MRAFAMLGCLAALLLGACIHDWDPVTHDGAVQTDVAADVPCTACSGGCFVLDNDPANCGSCGNVCPVPDNATATCTAGVCGFECATGYGVCDNRCFQRDINLSFCGEACVDCAALPHVNTDTVGCSHGACTLLNACADGWGDCDGVSSNGCETDLSVPEHCGSCAQHCTSSAPRCVVDPGFGTFGCAH